MEKKGIEKLIRKIFASRKPNTFVHWSELKNIIEQSFGYELFEADCKKLDNIINDLCSEIIIAIQINPNGSVSICRGLNF